MSYTTFDVNLIAARSSTSPDSMTCTVSIKNTGSRKGGEVVQIYFGYPASAGEPVRQLKGFERVVLEPGAQQTVDLVINQSDMRCV